MRYLICEVGAYSIAIMSTWVRHIEDNSTLRERTDVHVDARSLLKTPGQASSAVLTLENDRVRISFVIDLVREMVTIADGEFIPLPQVFEFANHFFDSACRIPINGRFPLRLRPQLFAEDFVATAPL
jgi:hypothetical protein